MLSLTFVGRIVEKKEIITTSTGKKVCNFTMVNDKYNGKEKEKSSDFFQVAAWGGTAEFIDRNFKVGQLIAIQGTLINNHYEKDGVKHYAEKIIAYQVEYAGYNKSEISTEG